MRAHRRIAATSGGFVVIELSSHRKHGRTAFVSTFDERGWQRETKRWTSDPESAVHIAAASGPFATFLSDVVRIPPAEAEELADNVMSEWEASGSEKHARSLSYASDIVVTVIFGSLVVAVIVVAALALAGLKRVVRRS